MTLSGAVVSGHPGRNAKGDMLRARGTGMAPAFAGVISCLLVPVARAGFLKAARIRRTPRINKKDAT